MLNSPSSNLLSNIRTRRRLTNLSTSEATSTSQASQTMAASTSSGNINAVSNGMTAVGNANNSRPVTRSYSKQQRQQQNQQSIR